MSGKIKYFFLVFIYLLLVLPQALGNDGKPPLKIGDKAPDFTLNDPSGKPVTLSSLKGKIVLIDFWASWCGYCKEANEDLIPIYDTYKKNGFEILSISLDSKKELWVNSIKNQNLSWPYHVSELKGWEDSKVALSYSVEALPAAFLVDENGIIIEDKVDVYGLEKKLNWLFLEQINFYPRIATTKIFFTGKAKYEIIDGKGKMIIKGKDAEANISSLSPGEYTIKYEDKIDKFTKKNGAELPVSFFPERADDKITLSREAEYEIYNMRGKSVKIGKEISIEISDLETGAYYLFIDGDRHSFYKK